MEEENNFTHLVSFLPRLSWRPFRPLLTLKHTQRSKDCKARLINDNNHPKCSLIKHSFSPGNAVMRTEKSALAGCGISPLCPLLEWNVLFCKWSLEKSLRKVIQSCLTQDTPFYTIPYTHIILSRTYRWGCKEWYYISTYRLPCCTHWSNHSLISGGTLRNWQEKVFC